MKITMFVATFVLVTPFDGTASIAASSHQHHHIHRASLIEGAPARRLVHAITHQFTRLHGQTLRLVTRHHGRSERLRSAGSERLIGSWSASAPTSTGDLVQTGNASYYSGGRTAAGGRVGAATCAHRSLPFGTRVLVTNLANLKAAVLTVNDRGPFTRGRIVDVSRGAAEILGMLRSGVTHVKVQVLGRAG